MKTLKNPILVTLPHLHSAGLDRLCDWYGYFNMENQEEIWKDVVEYEGLYQVSNFGVVKSLPRIVIRHNSAIYFKRETIALQFCNHQGYLSVALSKDGIQKRYQSHRIIATAFIPNPENKPQINHKNSHRADNYVGNLEWATAKENVIHSFYFGNRKAATLGKNGENCINGKAVFQYSMSRKFISKFVSGLEAKRITGIDNRNISSCASGSRASAGGFIWTFKEIQNANN